jgi:hypothetical protein
LLTRQSNSLNPLFVFVLQVGAVSGAIGQIITKDISYDQLAAAIRAGEECIAEDPRPTSSLKSV